MAALRQYETRRRTAARPARAGAVEGLVDRGRTVVTPERFAQGMTFDQYVAYVGTPENLDREAVWWLGPRRRDFSDLLRDWYGRARLSVAQISQGAPGCGDVSRQAGRDSRPGVGALHG